MSRVVKNVLACLVGTLLFVSAWAQESESVPEAISVNFGQTLSGDDTVGLEPVAAKQWVCVGNVGGATGGQPAELSSVTLKDQTGKVYPGAKLKVASRGGMWQNGSQNSLTERLLYNFIDDSNGSNEACVEVTNVPFARYTVYVYFNGDFTEGDVNKFPPYEVNGKLYKGNGSTTVQITDFTSGVTTWGTVKKSALQEGQNVLKVTGQSADTLRIYASRYASVEGFTPSSPSGARGCISAIQIVSEDASETSVPMPTFACSFDGNSTPAGWFTGWGGETPSAYVQTPFGKGFVVGDTVSPYYGLGAKNVFSLMLYADIAAVDVSDTVPKVLAAFGTKDSHIALMKTAMATVEVWQNKQKVGNLSIKEDALKAGFHLLAFGNDTTGSFLSVDGTRVSGGVLERPADGFQVGSLYGGFGDNSDTVWKKSVGMIVDEVRGYDTVLTADQVAALAKVFPATLVRTLTGDAEWQAENAWGEGMATPANASSVELTVASDATLTMNADAALSYLSVEGEGTLTFAGDKKLSSASTHIATDVNAVNGVASLGEVSVAEGKTLTVGAMTLSSLNAAGATFATVGTGTTTLKAMVGAPASITVGDGSTLVLPASVSQGGWVTPYVVGAGATLDVNGVYDNSNTSLSLAEDATLTNGGTDVDDSKRQWQNLAIATPGGTVTVSGNTFGSVSSNHNEHFLTLNGGTLNVEMNDGKSFYMANLAARKTAEDTSEDTSEAGTIQVASGTLRLTHGGDYSRVNLNLTGGEVLSDSAQTFGSLSGTGGTLNLNGQTLTVGAFGKTDIFSGAIVGSGTLTKEGVGTLDLSDVDFRLFEGSFALEAGTLILPAGREKELSQIVSGTTLTLHLSEAQEMAGYTATLPEGLSAEGVTFAFLDAEGTPLTEGVEGNVYVPKQTTAVTWNPTDGWSKESLEADDNVVIDFKETSGTCPLTVPAGVTLEALAIRGSGTVALSGNATVAALDVGSGTVSLGGAELTVTGSLEGTAALTLTSGKVVMQNAAVLANAYTGTLTLAGGEWWWGRASSTPAIDATSLPPALADSVVVQTGATLALHPWTTAVLTASTTDKVLFSAPITLEGGTFYTEDGSYYLKGPITVNQSSTVRTQWVKGIIVETLTGAANLTWEATTNTDGGEAWNEIRNAPDYSGTLALKRSGNGTRTLRLTSDTALQQANVIFEDTANKSLFKLTGDRTVGTFSGTGVTVTSDGDANRTLHIANATEEAFSGTITDKINLNIHADAALIMAGTLGTVSGTPQTASYSRSLTLDGTLTFRSVVPTTLTASWSGAGVLIVGDGEEPAFIAFSGANGGYSGRTEVRTGATLEYNGISTVPFGKGTIVNDGLVRMAQDSEAQIPPMSGSGDLEVAGSARMAGPLTLSGTVTVAAGKTLTLSRHQTDFTGTPSIDGPSLVLGDGAKVVKGEFGEGVTLALGTTLSGAGTVEAPVTFAAGAVVDASAGAPTLTQGVTLPTEGTVSVKAPAEGHGTVLTANDLDAAKFALVEGSARQALTATASALVLMQLPEGVDVSSAAGKAILAAANAANVTNVEKVEGDAIDGAALFTDVVTVDGATATVAYDFGISRMFIRKEGETTYLYIAAKVSTDYAEGTAVKVFQDSTEVEATPVTEGVPNEAGVKWLRVAYPADTFGTHHYTIQAASAEP